MGNEIKGSVSGVDAKGATFLLNSRLTSKAVIFAFSAFFRESTPVRFQIWRPSATGNRDQFTLIQQYRVIPSVTLTREDVSTYFIFFTINRPVAGTLVNNLFSPIFHFEML